jgi:hypothetical protein
VEGHVYTSSPPQGRQRLLIYLWPLARIPSPAVVGNKIEFSVIYELFIFETNIIYQMTEGFTPDRAAGLGQS